MEFFIDNIYTIALIPLWVFLVILLAKVFAVLQSRRFMVGLTIISTLYGLVFSAVAFWQTHLNPNFVYEFSYTFLKINNFNFDIGVYLDALSALMLLVVCSVSLLVQLYSYQYMKNDKSFMRFFAYLNFFNFSMLGLVLSANMFQTYIFWELVGVASYLLIGFWYKKPSAAHAAKKAFFMNRIGDFGLLSGILFLAFILYNFAGNIDYIMLPFANLMDVADLIYSYTSDVAFIFICILLLAGSIAKSAQFPLLTWLPDAMEGPTPVSALIHSATMVAAGVYLIARLYPVYSLSPIVMSIIAIIGLVTALICAYSAITQTDLKRALAYSTSSQLGIMFFSLGAGGITCGMLHLTVHAYIKAMLFLCAGIVMHSLANNIDVRFMGGLRKQLPVCAACFFIGCLSLSGILFSGFNSKELILSALIENGHIIYAVFFLLLTFMTAFYMFRLYFLVFEGNYRGSVKIEKSTLLFDLPVIILAIITILLTFVLPKVHNYVFAAISLTGALLGMICAYVFYNTEVKTIKLPVFYNLSFNAFYLDDFYNHIVDGFSKLARICNRIDKYIFDGFVMLASLKVRIGSWIFSKMQTGNVQSYLAYSVIMITLVFFGLILAYTIIIYISEV